MSYKDNPWCWQFIIFEFFVIISGRFCAIHASYYMFACCKGDPKNKLSFNEITFLAYAAFIRGCIAFGLVENIDPHILPNKPVVVSSVLCLVCVSTVLIGSLTPPFKKWVLPDEIRVSNGEDQSNIDIIRASENSGALNVKIVEVENIDDNIIAKGIKKTQTPENHDVKHVHNAHTHTRASHMTHYTDFKHPNLISLANS